MLKCKYCDRVFEGKGPVKARLVHHEGTCRVRQGKSIEFTPSDDLGETTGNDKATEDFKCVPLVDIRKQTMQLYDPNTLINLVDKTKYLALWTSIERWLSRIRDNNCLWQEHYDAMKLGEDIKADKIFRKIFDIKGPEMTEDAKEKLRQYAIDNKEKIKANAKAKRDLKKRRKMLAKEAKC